MGRVETCSSPTPQRGRGGDGDQANGGARGERSTTWEAPHRDQAMGAHGGGDDTGEDYSF